MKNILLILMLFSISFSFAQKKAKRNDVFLNLAGNYNYRNYTTVLYAPKFSPALSLFIRSQPNRMWEVGFSQLYFEKRAVTNATVYNLLLGINLTHNWIFLTENEFPIKPILGAGIYTYLSNYDYQPKTSLTFGESRQAWGMELGITPGFLYEHQKWIFSLTNPIGLGDWALIKTKSADPNLSIRKQRINIFSFSPEIGYMGLKLGIARKI